MVEWEGQSGSGKGSVGGNKGLGELERGVLDAQMGDRIKGICYNDMRVNECWGLR